jgi:hypothetical protein
MYPGYCYWNNSFMWGREMFIFLINVELYIWKNNLMVVKAKKIIFDDERMRVIHEQFGT